MSVEELPDEVKGVRVERVSPEGPAIATTEQHSDLIGTAWYQQADLLAIPASRLDEAFFDLSSGQAGDLLQKAVNYRVRLAIVGDVSAYTETSESFAAFVWEANRGAQVWFVPDEVALDAKLRG